MRRGLLGSSLETPTMRFALRAASSKEFTVRNLKWCLVGIHVVLLVLAFVVVEMRSLRILLLGASAVVSVFLLLLRLQERQRRLSGEASD